MFPLLDFAISALQSPELIANQMAAANITPTDMASNLSSGALGALADPASAAASAGSQMQNAAQGMLPPGPQVTKNPAGSVETAVIQDPEIYNRFMGRVARGVTNPNGYAAVAATGERESGFSAANAYGTWDDVGKPAGGILSWRDDRLRALQQGRDMRDITPEDQADFFLRENPDLIAKLNAAESPDEAMGYMNEAWKFNGYDNPQHPETSARFAAARNRLGSPSPTDIGAMDPGHSSAESGFISQPDTNALPAGGMTPAPTSQTGGLMSSFGSQFPTKPQSLGDKLATIGAGLGKAMPPAPEAQRPPAAVAPNVGGGFGRDPQAIAQFMQLLQPAAGAGGPPSLASLLGPIAK